MISKKVLELATIKAIVAPFEFLSYRIQCDPNNAFISEDLIQYADATTLKLGTAALWTGYDIEMFRILINVNLGHYRRKRENILNRTGLSTYLI